MKFTRIRYEYYKTILHREPVIVEGVKVAERHWHTIIGIKHKYFLGFIPYEHEFYAVETPKVTYQEPWNPLGEITLSFLKGGIKSI